MHKFILFVLYISASIQAWIPKILWTYWQQGISQDQHWFKLFNNNHHQMLGQQWDIRFLNKTSVWYWLNQIPDFGDALNRTQFQRTFPQARGNLVRIALLQHFGGVWIDYTMILVENFDWILNINQSTQVLNKYGEFPEMIFLDGDATFQYTYQDTESGQTYYLYPDFETFFIASVPKAKFAVDVYQYYKDGHFKKSIFNIFGTNYFIEEASKNNYTTGHYHKPYFQFEIAIQTVMNKKQRQLDQKANNGHRELAVKYYKVWNIPVNDTAYKFTVLQHRWQYHPVSIVMQSDIDYLKSVGIYPNHFVKFIKDNRWNLEKFFLTEFETKFLDCQGQHYILKNSIGYKFLLENYPVKFYANVIRQYSFDRSCIFPFQARTKILMLQVSLALLITIIIILSIRIYILQKYSYKNKAYHEINNDQSKPLSSYDSEFLQQNK